jgi:hypothetical protein
MEGTTKKVVILGTIGDSDKERVFGLQDASVLGAFALWTAVIWWTTETLTIHGLLEPFGIGSQSSALPETITLPLPKDTVIHKVLAREFPNRGTRLLLLTNDDRLFVSNPSIGNHNSPSFWTLLNWNPCTKIIDMAISDSELCIASSDAVLIYSLEDVFFPAIAPVNQAQHTLPLKSQCKESLSFKKIVAGSNHFLGLTVRGDVFSTGSNLHGQLGTGAGPRTQQKDGNRWEHVEALAGMRMVDIAAGDLHSLFLSESGDVYSTGTNGHGQLGSPSSDSAEHDETKNGWGLPMPVFEVPIAPVGQMGIAAGARHSLVWSKGAFFGSGDARWGQIGQSSVSERTISSFKLISAPLNTQGSIKGIWAGAWTSVLLIEEPGSV